MCVQGLNIRHRVLCCCTCVVCVSMCVQGLDEDIVVRLPEWRIHSKHMWVSHYDLFEPDQEPGM